MNTRGITDAVVDEYKLGWGNFYRKWWITIPIKDEYGAYSFFKLRRDPNAGNENLPKGMIYPKGTQAQIYGWALLQGEAAERILICEGELDKLALASKGVPAITGTAGAGTFKQEWADRIAGKYRKTYICYDNDEPGKRGVERVAAMLSKSDAEVYVVTLSAEVGEHGDITDYLVEHDGDPEDLFGKYAKRFSEWEKLERVKKVKKPERIVNFEEWQGIIKNNFPEMVFPAEVGLSIISQILFDGKNLDFVLKNPFDGALSANECSDLLRRLYDVRTYAAGR